MIYGFAGENVVHEGLRIKDEGIVKVPSPLAGKG